MRSPYSAGSKYQVNPSLIKRAGTAATTETSDTIDTSDTRETIFRKSLSLQPPH
jgi:hypothetical protein